MEKIVAQLEAYAATWDTANVVLASPDPQLAATGSCCCGGTRKVNISAKQEEESVGGIALHSFMAFAQGSGLAQ